MRCLSFFTLIFLTFSRLVALPKIDEMTLEEKVGQLLIVHFIGTDLNDEAKTFIHKAHVGGFIYFNWANDLTNKDQVKKLSDDLQQESKIPLFISADQEGGRVSRFTLFPSLGELGASKNPEYIEEVSYKLGSEIAAVGLNLNYSPVVDVNSNPKNPMLGDRSFGDDPKLVAEYAARVLTGLKRANIYGCLKHFPGHGDTSTDSHFTIPLVKKSKVELEEVELVPYVKLGNQAEFIMTAHLIAEGIDPDQIATLSPKVVRKLLREEIGYQGIIITDSFFMDGLLLSVSSLEEAALQALLAGNDILLMGGGKPADRSSRLKEVLSVHKFLCEAVRKGDLPEEQVNGSLERIFNVKNRF